MVVGVLTTSYPRFAGDGAGSFVADDVARLARAGAAVDVIAAGDGPAGVTHDSDGSVTVTRIGTGAPGAAPATLFYGDGAPETLERRGLRAWIAGAYFTAALHRQVAGARARWDAVISHWLVPCGWVAAAAAGSLPHRAYAHSGDVALLERLPAGAAIARRLAASAADLAFVSRDLQLRFAALVGRRVGRVERLIPDAAIFRPASLAERSAARRRLGLTRPTVVAVGRLIPIKGFDLLVDAVAGLAGAGCSADVVIVGAGAEHDRLRARAQRRSVALRLPGSVPRSDLPAWLAAADVYVQPSRPLGTGRTEGVPLAALEALAVGAPVVAARTGGLAELDGPSVTFFEPGDTLSLRAALLLALRPARASIASPWPRA